MEDRTIAKVAVLIDAENISYKNAQQIIDVMSGKGEVVIREIVADWSKITKSKLIGSDAKGKISHREKQTEGWRAEAGKYSMTATQQFCYVPGKNTSDIALTILALKILFEKPYITTFCLVSNDSDFTRLAQELRMQNKEVIGMGEKGKAIPEFVNAFSEFVYLGEALPDEVIQERQEEKKEEIPAVVVEKALDGCPLDRERLEALKKLADELIEEYDGDAQYSLLSDKMKKQFADFVPSNYGCKNVSKLVEKLLYFMPDYIEHREAIPNNPNGWVMSLRRKIKSVRK